MNNTNYEYRYEYMYPLHSSVKLRPKIHQSDALSTCKLLYFENLAAAATARFAQCLGEAATSDMNRGIERARVVWRLSVGTTTLFGVSAIGLYLLAPRQLMRLFTDKQDIVEEAAHYMWIAGLYDLGM